MHLRIEDDDVIQHVLELKECVCLPESPVNVMSVRRLAENYPDADGRPDRGTGILSLLDEHHLFWDGEKGSKHFTTTGDGLPQCIFNKGNKKFEHYCSIIEKQYDDRVSN